MPKLIVTSMEQTLLPQIAMQSAYAMKILHFKMILVEYIVVYQAVYGGFQVSDKPSLYHTFLNAKVTFIQLSTKQLVPSFKSIKISQPLEPLSCIHSRTRGRCTSLL